MAYDASIPIEHYILTVAAQVPVVDAIIKWLGFKTIAEFDGMVGILLKQMIYVTNGWIIIRTFNSYFRQKCQIRRLMQGLASKKGDIPVLQAQASRAREEIKSDIIESAIEHPEAHNRHRAMSVAMYANILSFPQTMIHNLHLETVKQNNLRRRDHPQQLADARGIVHPAAAPEDSHPGSMTTVTTTATTC